MGSFETVIDDTDADACATAAGGCGIIPNVLDVNIRADAGTAGFF